MIHVDIRDTQRFAHGLEVVISEVLFLNPRKSPVEVLSAPGVVRIQFQCSSKVVSAIFIEA